MADGVFYIIPLDVPHFLRGKNNCHMPKITVDTMDCRDYIMVK
jgi:hypothetical protein